MIKTMDNIINQIKENLAKSEKLKIFGSGNLSYLKTFLLLDLLKLSSSQNKPVVFITKNNSFANLYKEQADFLITSFGLSKKLNTFVYPGWNTVPYDRNSPDKNIMGQRISVLHNLRLKNSGLIFTTLLAVLQKIPEISNFNKYIKRLYKGIEINNLSEFFKGLVECGYVNSSEVITPGDFVQRGGIVDIFPVASKYPIRLDFFDTVIEKMKFFDPITQKTITEIDEIELLPASEVILNEDTVLNFRKNYRDMFNLNIQKDILYKSVSENIRYNGLENWLPLFYNNNLKPFASFLDKDSIIVYDENIDNIIDENVKLINNYYENRIKEQDEDSIYNPVKIDTLYDLKYEFNLRNNTKNIYFSDIETPSFDENYIDISNNKKVETFKEIKPLSIKKYYDSIITYIKNINKTLKVIISYNDEKYKERLKDLFLNYNLHFIETDIKKAIQINNKNIFLTNSSIEGNFFYDGCLFLDMSYFFDVKNNKKKRRKSKHEEFIEDLSSLEIGDLVVHKDHGIGRFDGLTTVSVQNSRHDCLKIIYKGEDKLFVPVENLDILSKYSNTDSEIPVFGLDKLGGILFAKRKAKIQNKIREIAGKLLKIAAKRFLKKTPSLIADTDKYNKFKEEFPYVETEDQENAIENVIDDLEKTTPMDRLICGDVGFGKTEVAMRAAFVAALNKKQVAVLVPTTLLCRQHYIQFKKRFENFDFKIAELSRFTSVTNKKIIKDKLKAGEISIVIGTHALLAKDIGFKDLGLLIIDEEQHFGVKHKEKIKELKENVNILTITATPIPRTLQLSLSGIRELSLITTPPVDRLPIETFVITYDSLTIKDAVLREISRDGQAFYITPRIKYIERIHKSLKALFPNLKIAVANGQIPAKELELIIEDFENKKYDILIATNIIESGIDLPNVNTLIVDRPDLFGLAQLYQLRGRIGRSNKKAYCYLTVKNKKYMSPFVKKKLEILKELDYLGAGFKLASFDMDLRGAGNLLGEEQTGHIKEVGAELYFHMLESEISKLKKEMNISNEAEQNSENQPLYREFSTQINVQGLSVFIPKDYVEDDKIRLELYSKLSKINTETELEDFKEELLDRFGDYPSEVSNLIQITKIKLLAYPLNIERVDANKQGIVLDFYKKEAKNPEKLIKHITTEPTIFKIMPDNKLLYQRGVLTNNWFFVLEKALKILTDILN